MRLVDDAAGAAEQHVHKQKRGAMVRATRKAKANNSIPVGVAGKENSTAASFSKDDVSLARTALLAAVNGTTSARPFLNLFGAACSNSNVPNLIKPGILLREQRQLLQQALNQQESSTKFDFAKFFDGLHTLVTASIERQDFIPESAFLDGDEDEDENVNIVLDACSSEGLQLLQYAASCVRVFFNSLSETLQQSLKIPQLLQIAAALHDTLDKFDASWGPDAANAHQEIVKLCETWWLKKGQGRTDVIGHVLPLLVEAAVENKADMKRLFQLRSALDIIDFEDEESDLFLSLLLRVASSSACLKTTEGKRFLSFLFSLGPTVTRKLHTSIRAQLHGNKRSILEDYSDVYFTAWKDAPSEESRLAFESDVLEDLVYSVLHAANPDLVTALLVVLSKFHDAKQSAEAEALVYRLYGPVLWRAIAAANAKVRVNAVKVLSRVFPLPQPHQQHRINTKTGKDFADLATQKACAALRTLLQDPDSRVRVAASEAVAHILSVCWDGIPSDDIRRLLNHLVAEHASDASAYEVRVGAVNAFSLLLQAPQSHAVLRELLPKVANLIHDKVEQVRLAVVRMLIEIKKVPNFKYYRICPLDHLVLQLGVEGKRNVRSSVATTLTSLLANTYFPDGPKADCAEQLRRTLKFLSEADDAAQVFYTNVWKFRSTHSVGQLTFQLLSCLHSLVQEQDKHDVTSTGTEKGKKRRMKTKAGSYDRFSGQEGNEPLPPHVLANIAETIVILWKSIESKLQGHDEWNQFLVNEFSGPKLTFILTYYGNKAKAVLNATNESDDDDADLECFHRICTAILQCAAMLPSKAVVDLVPYVSSVIASANDSDDFESSEDITAHVVLLCLWGMTEEVAAALGSSIKAAFTQNVLFSARSVQSHVRRDGRSKGGQPLDIPNLPCRIALRIVADVFQGSNPNCPLARSAILSSQSACDNIEKALEEGKRQAELLLEDQQVARDSDGDYILEACEMYGRFVLHKEAFHNGSVSYNDVTNELLHWTSQKVVPVFGQRSPTSVTAPFVDPNLSSILMEKSFDAIGSSPEPINRQLRRANRNKTPERPDDGIRFSMGSLSLAQDSVSAKLVQRAFATSLLTSSCILFSEWLAVGGSGASHISHAAVADWCQVFKYNDFSTETVSLVAPAFFRLAIQLAKLHDDFVLMKELLSIVRDVHLDGTNFIRKALVSLLAVRANKSSPVPRSLVTCVMEAASDMLETDTSTLVFEFAETVSTLWDNGRGSISSAMNAIFGNQSASLELTRYVVETFAAVAPTSPKKALFGLKCLWLLCDKGAGSKVATEASSIVRQRLNRTGLEGDLRDLADILLENCSAQ